MSSVLSSLSDRQPGVATQVMRAGNIGFLYTGWVLIRRLVDRLR